MLLEKVGSFLTPPPPPRLHVPSRCRADVPPALRRRARRTGGGVEYWRRRGGFWEGKLARDETGETRQRLPFPDARPATQAPRAGLMG